MTCSLSSHRKGKGGFPEFFFFFSLLATHIGIFKLNDKGNRQWSQVGTGGKSKLLLGG